jgi:hypothetical protein
MRFQRLDIQRNRFLDILDSLFARRALTDAAGQTGTFDHPETIFARI